MRFDEFSDLSCETLEAFLSTSDNLVLFGLEKNLTVADGDVERIFNWGAFEKISDLLETFEKLHPARFFKIVGEDYSRENLIPYLHKRDIVENTSRICITDAYEEFIHF